MTDKAKAEITAQEINRRYSTGDKFFEQGVELGMKSFDHFITISSLALGFLLSIKTGIIGDELILSKYQEWLFLSSVGLFVLSIIASILRNYYAGYGLVYRGERFIEKCNLLIGKDVKESEINHELAKRNEKATESKRKTWSMIGRLSFIGAILAFGGLVMLISSSS